MRITTSTICHAAVVAFLALQLCPLPANGNIPLGACCFPDLSCAPLEDEVCSEEGGEFIGVGTSCANIQCRASVETPVLSVLGLVGVVGALGGLGVRRLVRKRAAV